MSNQAAAVLQLNSSSQNPPPQQSREEDARNDAVKGRDSGLIPPPSAPPSLVNAVKSMTATHDPLSTLRERPREKSFDSPYARSTTSTAPGSPRFPPVRQNSGSHTPRVRPHATTLSIPGMTRSRVSPDGKIAERDVAAKLVIIMVGLPARGKSYITNKIQRYLSWQQHDARIFNVGNRRRIAAGMRPESKPTTDPNGVDGRLHAATVLLNGVNHPEVDEPTALDLNSNSVSEKTVQDLNIDPSHRSSEGGHDVNKIDQSANFFDPSNATAAQLREKVAMDTLDEVLDYLVNSHGAVGILDATNSTLKRRDLLVQKIREREPKLGILFIESICHDKTLLEANMRLKLSGPDYKDKDPTKSLEDFKARVKAYESAYVPLGQHEEEQDLQYIQMIDVGRKVIHHRLKGFLSGTIASYLTTFNLAPRQIWITRHGQSEDNKLQKLGGNSHLTERGHCYAAALYQFLTHKREEWLVEQKDRVAQSSFPPKAGDNTPPYPEIYQELEEKNFCVWTSMLHRTIETAEFFDNDDDYDVKNWEMLNELNAGTFEGMTYDEIAIKYPEEYQKRTADKLNYIYPGVGGEGYLAVISRLRDMVREMERVTDHVLVISHRSVCRVLMAYFMDLSRGDIAELDVPLGMLYCIEPKPYGYEFHAYKYDEPAGWFNELPDYKPQKATDRNN
ncbi:6-phosphofructo-2-kinase 1 [Cytospora mali]|uniref:6-phosphofructo-2-kinase 1 n=1 Tax=Cytospora mali TaxID=578113 RepID=A0A194VT08_CYTMA|nr:6-phosphofructo-2-kinase 1 [Valsa mali]